MSELFNLQLSDEMVPVLEMVKAFIANDIEPLEPEFHRAQNRDDIWTLSDRQSEILESLKAKAREQGLWNFFLPDWNGQGVSNLDYAYLAQEMGRCHLAPEVFNCSAPDTGNMEVLAKYGTPAQQKQWLEPLLAGEIPLGLRNDRARCGLVGCKEYCHHSRVGKWRVGHQWREILYLRCRRQSLRDHDRHGQDRHRPRYARPPATEPDPGADGCARGRDSRADDGIW